MIHPRVRSPLAFASLGSCASICFNAYLQQSQTPLQLIVIV